jgi:hypothetical protein
MRLHGLRYALAINMIAIMPSIYIARIIRYFGSIPEDWRISVFLGTDIILYILLYLAINRFADWILQRFPE